MIVKQDEKKRTRGMKKRRSILLKCTALLLAAMLTGCAGQADAGSAFSAALPGDAPSSACSDSTDTDSEPFSAPPSAGEPEERTPGLPPLHVDGTGLADPEGNPVCLRGVSTHGLAWFPDYVNETFFRELREEWNANVVRLAMYTAESGGYCTDGDQARLRQLVRDGVRYAGEQGMYVIVDWHILSDGDPNIHAEEAAAFFAEMSAEFSGCSHVLYEICNEPNGVGWSAVKTYAQTVIPVIRANDPDAVILVGTPTWSQDVDQAAADPIAEYDNLLYTLHFYAATHKEALRSRLEAALDAGLPVFVSEFGICDASGNGAIDLAQTDAWMELLDERGIGRVAWNLSNKAETSAMFNTSCTKTSGFAWDDLSASGQWVYGRLTGADFSAVPRENKNDAPASPGDAPSGDAAGQGTATLSSGDFTVSASLQNQWEADGAPVYQYRLTVTNTAQTDCARWEIELPFSGAITLLDGWNGDYTVRGDTLVICGKDYNGALAPGGSAEDIGFIVSGGALAPK